MTTQTTTSTTAPGSDLFPAWFRDGGTQGALDLSVAQSLDLLPERDLRFWSRSLRLSRLEGRGRAGFGWWPCAEGVIERLSVSGAHFPAAVT
jgi:hypothetical protein